MATAACSNEDGDRERGEAPHVRIVSSGLMAVKQSTVPPEPLVHKLLVPGLVADRVEVGVALRELAEAIRQLDRLAQVPDRVGVAPGEALAAREAL